MAQIGVVLIVVLFILLTLALVLGAAAAVITFVITALWTLVSGDSVPIAYNLRNLLVRRTTSLAAGGGIGVVVWVLANALMVKAGVQETMGSSGNPDVAMVVRKGADNEMSSTIETPSIGLIMAGPGVKKDDKGAPMGVAESVVVISKEKVGSEGLSNLMVRGVPDNVLTFRPEVRIIDGRPPKPGSDEAVAGRAIRGRFAGIDLGQTFELRKNRAAKIVGIFDAGGASYESEVWMDIDMLRSAFGRDGTVNSVRVKLDSPSAYDGFAAYVQQDKQLGFESARELDYYRKQSQATADLLSTLGNIIAFLFSLAAMIGATITMYSSVSERQREIGTLRALGFSRRAILFGFQLESLVLALVGGLVGMLVSLSSSFIKLSMVNFNTWSELVFRLRPTPALLVASLIGAAVMGLLGGFLPAVRAARISAVKAMRD